MVDTKLPGNHSGGNGEGSGSNRDVSEIGRQDIRQNDEETSRSVSESPALDVKLEQLLLLCWLPGNLTPTN